MSKLWPFSGKVVRLLERPPAPGETHHWLAQAAGGVAACGMVARGDCARFLRDVCEMWVRHRPVPEREIDAAVALAYDTQAGPPDRKVIVSWPGCDKAEREAVIAKCGSPLFDGSADSGVTAPEALAGLFGPDEVVCGGLLCEMPAAGTLEGRWQSNGAVAQFVCPNPLRGEDAVANKAGRLSVRCQANIAVRRWIVAEFDDSSLAKADQAKIASVLSSALPLKMAVDSGGKSLHCWFRCEGLAERDVALFFAWAVPRWEPIPRGGIPAVAADARGTASQGRRAVGETEDRLFQERGLSMDAFHMDQTAAADQTITIPAGCFVTHVDLEANPPFIRVARESDAATAGDMKILLPPALVFFLRVHWCCPEYARKRIVRGKLWALLMAGRGANGGLS